MGYNYVDLEAAKECDVSVTHLKSAFSIDVADNAAEFVSLAIQQTPAGQDPRFGVWFEPLLPRLCPLREEPEGIL